VTELARGGGGVLLLTPSRGRGGGIERYVKTLEWAFADQHVSYQRMDLRGSGPAAQARLLAEARKVLRQAVEPLRLVVAHRGLLPLAGVLSRGGAVNGISVICHGSDVWGARGRLRESIEYRVMRRPEVRVVAVSSYTAGALLSHCRATVLPPALSEDWFGTLVAAAAETPPREPGWHLATTFTLAHWRDKGLPELLAAIAALRRDDVRLTVCGSGDPSPELRQCAERYPFCVLRPGCTDQELAQELARADLFVLATRTGSGRGAVGEGFGMVLTEAQVAGTPVVGPAYGGSRDAYLDGVTGCAPTGESVADLSRVLADLLRHPGHLTVMGERAAEWARECFAPGRYPAQVAARLL
jgi:phosphatidyl-myo-inositol dimannoside synthase